MTVRRLAKGGRIDRAKILKFRFNGQSYQGYQGDTLASALMANGVDVVARSFKYHRPRGIIGSGAEEPNAILQVGEGAETVPNLRATQVELYDGLVAESVNDWPNLDQDIGVLNSLFGRLLPAGFYYKTFMHPQSMWEKYERVIRKAAGLGRAPQRPDPHHYEKTNHHCDVLVVGGGVSGLTAALTVARSGMRVTVVDDQNEWGGQQLNRRYRINQRDSMEYIDHLVSELQRLEQVKLLKRTCVYAYLDHNFIAAVEKITDHDPHAFPETTPREKMWRIRARRVILATGAFERPLVFHNNDRPGVILASAASAYLNRYAVRAGKRWVVFTNNDSAYSTVLNALDAGLDVVAVVDSRSNSHGDDAVEVRQRGVRIFNRHVVVDVKGYKRVHGVKIAAIDRNKQVIKGTDKEIDCNTLAVSGGWSPAVHLHAQSGGKCQWNSELACFVPGENRQAVVSCGSGNGEFSLKGCVKQAVRAAVDTLAALGCEIEADEQMEIAQPSVTAIDPLWLVPSPHKLREGAKQFVDYQNDTSAADIDLAIQEGYYSIEHIKRYTALGFGTDQGKLGNINGMAIAAQILGQSIPETGTTTFRPAYTPVTFGAVAGPELGDLFDPVRKTALHQWHVEQGAEFENVGQWKRPWYYPRKEEDMHAAVNRECLAARNGVAIMDASTLGKIDIKGRDAAEFLNRVYTNNWKKLAIGRCRYGLMLGEDGMVMDDGVTTRIGDDHYYMTTTTGGAAHVMAWLERWLQTEWPELEVFLTSVTDHWATIGLVGPQSRRVLQNVVREIDWDDFAFMSMQAGKACGVNARIFRISFSGELSYEISVPANYAHHVWAACIKAGEAENITPYGTETMHVLRAEKGFIIVGQDTDGSVTPVDLGMDWIVSKTKDFIGRRSLSRSDCLRSDRKQLVGLRSDIPHQVLPEGAQLVADANDLTPPAPMIGHVSSSYYSASLGHGIALALIKGGHSKMGEKVYAPLADGRTLVASICTPPYTRSNFSHGTGRDI